jgi:hypothetical protein
MSYIVIDNLDSENSVTIEKDNGSTYQTIAADGSYEGFISDLDIEQIRADLTYYTNQSKISFVLTEHIPLNRDPTVNDDSADHLKVGDRWFNTSTKRSWFCNDNSAGAAVWVTRGDLLSGTGDPDGSVSGNFGDLFFDTDQSRFYINTSNTSGTSWERLMYVS